MRRISGVALANQESSYAGTEIPGKKYWTINPIK